MAVVLSTLFFAALFWPSGVGVSHKDARQYLMAGYQLASGEGLTVPTFDPVENRIDHPPLSHFPPLTSVVYGTLLGVGVTPWQVPTVVSLVGWFFLVAGLAVLTGRLSGSSTLAVVAVALATLTTPYLSFMGQALSEPLFLPLLAWGVVFLERWESSGHPGGRRIGPLIGGATAFGLLTLSRHVGIVPFALAVLWWAWRRWHDRHEGTGGWIREGAVWLLAILPFGVWLLRNLQVAETLVGGTHLEGPMAHRELWDFPRLFLEQASWIFLPAVRPGPVGRSLGAWGVGACALMLAFGIFLLARAGLPPSRRLRSMSLPLVLLGGYMAFFLVASQVLYIRAWSERYMAVALVLLQPVLLALWSRVPRGRVRFFFSLFLGLQVLFLLLLSGVPGRSPAWWSCWPPGFRDLGGQPTAIWSELERGVPRWLVHRPPRVRDLERHHPALAGTLASLDPRPVIVSNAPGLFPYHVVVPSEGAIEEWLEAGGCARSGPDRPVAVVVMDWDRWAESYSGVGRSPGQLVAAVEERCPKLRRMDFSHSTLWMPLAFQPAGRAGELSSALDPLPTGVQQPATSGAEQISPQSDQTEGEGQ